MRQAEVAQHLRTHSLFADLPNRHLRRIAAVTAIEQIEPGVDLIRAGAPSSNAYLVLAGEAEVVRDGEAVARIGPGEFAGELGLLSNRARMATVTAVTNLEVIVLSETSMQTLIALVPELGWVLLKEAVSRLDDNASELHR